MNKRYQVFISSTFSDLQDERREVMQTVMKIDCIPAGMELFPAADEEQLDFIKKIIDDCDYYIIIIGGRYGSVTSDGVSYTEKEYDYAISKGIRVLAFLHEQPSKLSVEKSDIDAVARDRLGAFREKVSKGRIVKFWKAPTDLPGAVMLALISAIKTYPAVGWVRGDVATAPDLLAKLNALRNENDELKRSFELLEQQTIAKPSHSIANGSDKFVLHVEFDGDLGWSKRELSLSWDQIFGIVGPKLLGPTEISSLKGSLDWAIAELLGKSDSSYTISQHDFETITIQLEALRLIQFQDAKPTKGGALTYLQLTEAGRRYLTEIRSIKKAQN
jgi:hypothetical protein